MVPYLLSLHLFDFDKAFKHATSNLETTQEVIESSEVQTSSQELE